MIHNTAPVVPANTKSIGTFTGKKKEASNQVKKEPAIKVTAQASGARPMKKFNVSKEDAEAFASAQRCYNEAQSKIKTQVMRGVRSGLVLK